MEAQGSAAVDLPAGLWEASRAPGGSGARSRIFEAYLPFARAVARRIRRERPGSDLDIDDLRQFAAEGLLQAIDRYDPERGAPFEAFAARRIAGNVLDGVAASSESRRQASFRNRVRAERIRSLRPEPQTRLSSVEALDALAALAAELAVGFILDDAAVAEAGHLSSIGPNAYESLAWAETARRIAAAVDGLPDQERRVVRLHYLEGLEFARIADTLSLSRGRISQIHAEALRRLRKRLPGHDQLFLQGP